MSAPVACRGPITRIYRHHTPITVFFFYFFYRFYTLLVHFFRVVVAWARPKKKMFCLVCANKLCVGVQCLKSNSKPNSN